MPHVHAWTKRWGGGNITSPQSWTTLSQGCWDLRKAHFKCISYLILFCFLHMWYGKQGEGTIVQSFHILHEKQTAEEWGPCRQDSHLSRDLCPVLMEPSPLSGKPVTTASSHQCHQCPTKWHTRGQRWALSSQVRMWAADIPQSTKYRSPWRAMINHFSHIKRDQNRCKENWLQREELSRVLPDPFWKLCWRLWRLERYTETLNQAVEGMPMIEHHQESSEPHSVQGVRKMCRTQSKPLFWDLI